MSMVSAGVGFMGRIEGRSREGDLDFAAKMFSVKIEVVITIVTAAMKV